MNKREEPLDIIAANGFFIVAGVYDIDEVNALVNSINSADQSNISFRKTKDLFAIRRFLIEVQAVKELIFNNKIKSLISSVFGDDYFIVKSIYFDKPAASNWFVPWHQDLTIAVERKDEIPGYGPWTIKNGQFAVQPPLDILSDSFTLRIHLDDTDEFNGALKVIPGSHLKGIYRPENIDWQFEKEVTCNVAGGDVMLMRPLLLHASNRTTNSKKRRVIHIEFSRAQLPSTIAWSEKDNF